MAEQKRKGVGVHGHKGRAGKLEGLGASSGLCRLIEEEGEQE